MKRRIIRLAAAFVLAAAGIAGCLIIPQPASYVYRGYSPSLPLDTEVREIREEEAYIREAFSIQTVPGMRAPALLARPKTGEGPYPAVLFLHGINQRKEFLDEIAAPFVEAGFVFITFDQLGRGEREGDHDTVFQKGIDLRRRVGLNAVEARRFADYLSSRSDIVAERIYLLGASFGAITGAAAAAHDPRFQAIVLTYGGGDIDRLMESQAMAEAAGPLVPVAKLIAAGALRAADPVNHVADIAPRPVLLQNGRQDTLINPAAAEALIAAVREPKDVIWYDSDHVGLDDAHTRRVIADAVAWLLTQDAAARGATSSAQPFIEE